jgi:Domain of unknown function (DUF5666)
MKTRVLGLVGFVLIFAVAALAHGDKKHVMGTVEKINSDSIVVKATDGKTVEVKLAPSTTYVSRAGNQDKPGKLEDVAVGDRVVIHATPNGETLTADQVKFSHGASHSTGASAKPKS